MSEFEIVNEWPGRKRARYQAGAAEACREAAKGKVVAFPLNGRRSASVRGQVASHGKKWGVKFETTVHGSTLYIRLRPQEGDKE